MNRERGLYIASIICLSLFPCTFLLMPFTVSATGRYARLAVGTTGVMFWVTGVGGYASLILVYAAEKKRKERKRRILLFSNILTSVADVLFIAGVVALTVLIGKEMTENYVAYVCIFVIILSWNLHWLFRRNFQKKLLNKRLQAGGKN